MNDVRVACCSCINLLVAVGVGLASRGVWGVVLSVYFIA